MQLICCHVAALAVASIFYTWRAYAMDLLGRHRLLRDRVAYLLWTVADFGEGDTGMQPGMEKAPACV